VARPLPLIAGGLALVAVDFRTGALDFLPDPLGWSLIALGAAALSLRFAPWLAGLVAVLSAPETYLPYRRVLLDPDTLEVVDGCTVTAPCPEQLRYDPIGGWHLVAMVVALVFAAACLVTVLRGLRRRALAAGDSPAASRLDVLALVVLLGWAAPPGVAMLRSAWSDPVAYDPIWNGSAEYLALLGGLVLAWLVVALSGCRGRAWALPTGSAQDSPWGDMIDP
jgi:hypothetical protein